MHRWEGIRIKIGITFILRLHRRPIQLVMFVPTGLSLFLQHIRQVLLGVEISSVALSGQLNVGVEVSSTPTRPVESVALTTKGLQERNTQLLDGTKVEK
jgi:hypothetical protein